MRISLAATAFAALLATPALAAPVHTYTALGITAPIVPGILPVTNLAQVQRIASLCGVPKRSIAVKASVWMPTVSTTSVSPSQ